MIYVIDHEDSFTFNLVHLLGIYDNVYTSNYYEIDKAKLVGRFLSMPNRDEINEPLNEQLVVELYSK